MNIMKTHSRKRELALLLVALLLICNLAVSAQTVMAESVLSGSSGTISWTLDETTGFLEISGSGRLERVVDMIGEENSAKVRTVLVNEGITSLAPETFANGEVGGSFFCFEYWWNALESVTLPEGIVTIPGGAFYGCSMLKEVILPEGLKAIGDYAFSRTGYGTGEDLLVGAPDSVEYIGKCAFSTSAIANFTMPSSLKELGSSAFSYCDRLTSVNIPDGITTISYGTFTNCTALETVTLADGVTTINANAFFECTALKEVQVSEALTYISGDAFNGCKQLMGDNGCVVFNDILCGVDEEKEEITIPNGVTRIETATFWNHQILKKVNLPDGLTEIGSSAFGRCAMLTDINIPDTVQSIKPYAFTYCTELKDINIPDSVTIGEGAFWNCQGLADANGFIIIRNTLYGVDGTKEEIVIPDGVTTIGTRITSTYVDNDVVKKIVIPDTVTTIETEAFAGLTALTDINIPTSVTKFGNGIFDDCAALADEHGAIVIDGTLYGDVYDAFDENGNYKGNSLYIGSDVKKIAIFLSHASFDMITIDPDNTSFVKHESGLYTTGYKTLLKANEETRSLEIVDGCTTIAYPALSGGYYKDVVIPASVTSIYDGMDMEYSTADGFVIYGEEGSYAEEYADMHGYEFKIKKLFADVNMDGVVNLADVQMVLKLAMKIIPASDEMIPLADTDEDSMITLYDAQYILKGVLKLITLPEVQGDSSSDQDSTPNNTDSITSQEWYSQELKWSPYNWITTG